MRDKGVTCESCDRPGKQKTSTRVDVDDIGLKSGNIPVEGWYGLQQVRRATALIERQVLDVEALEQRLMTSARRSDRYRMPLCNLRSGQVDGCIHDAVALVCHVVCYMQYLHLHLRHKTKFCQSHKSLFLGGEAPHSVRSFLVARAVSVCCAQLYWAGSEECEDKRRTLT